jgi:hypothetical protein
LFRGAELLHVSDFHQLVEVINLSPRDIINEATTKKGLENHFDGEKLRNEIQRRVEWGETEKCRESEKG